MSQVALVTMPWNSVRRGAINLGILKALLAEHGIDADILYLNIRLARLMRRALSFLDYEAIGEAHLIGEWLFSQHLFGRFGSGELQNSFGDLTSDGWQDVENTIGVKELLEFRNFDFRKISEEIIPQFIEECLTEIDWSAYKIVGFSSVFNQHIASLLLANKLKQRYPHLKIVFGGPNVHSVMGDATIKAFDWVDYVVDGEGEPVFPALVEDILAGKADEPRAGVSFRRGSEVVLRREVPPMYHLDEAPFPDYREYFSELEANGLANVDTFILFESSRGCWWGEKALCAFCGLNGQYLKFRAKSGQRIIEELTTQAQKYNHLFFYSVDNILDLQAFSDMLPELARRPLDLQLFYEVKANLNHEQVQLLRNAGITYIQPGIESLHTDILKLMKKGVTALQNLQLLKFCRASGIHANWNILYGFPGESRSQYEQISDTLLSISHLQPPVAAGRIVLQRFSPYFMEQDKLGIRNARPAALYSRIYPAGRVDLEDIAYYFDYSLDEDVEDPEDYIQPIKRAIEEWKIAYQKNKTFFRYRRGAGFIELQDTRPLKEGEATGLRRTTLRGLEAEVYLLCESIQSGREIARFVSKRSGGRMGEAEAALMLKRMVEKRWMFSEKDRYLSLATAAPPRITKRASIQVEAKAPELVQLGRREERVNLLTLINPKPVEGGCCEQPLS